MSKKFNKYLEDLYKYNEMSITNLTFLSANPLINAVNKLDKTLDNFKSIMSGEDTIDGVVKQSEKFKSEFKNIIEDIKQTTKDFDKFVNSILDKEIRKLQNRKEDDKEDENEVV
jgi:uncharacterized protein YoxC